jgi:hypothetical protein
MVAVLYAAVFMGISMAVMRSPLFSENPFHDTYPVFLMMLVYLISFPIIAFLAFLATALLVSAVQFAVSPDNFRSIRRRGGRRSRRADGPNPRRNVDQSGALKRLSVKNGMENHQRPSIFLPSASRGLDELERAELVSVGRMPGRSPVATILGASAANG